MSRKAIYVIVGVIVLFVIIVVALPFLIDANQFRPRVEAEASKALGRDVKVGNLTLSIFAGGVRATDLSIADDPAYGKQPFLTAKSMNIGVEMMPLITSRKLNIRSFTITGPSVNLIHGTNGKWNVSTLGGKTTSEGKGSSTTNFTVGRFALDNGTVTVIHLRSRAKPNVYSKVDLTADNLSLKSSFPFTFSAVPPGGGSINASGNFGPLGQGDSASTPMSAKIEIKKFDLSQTGFMDPASGIRGLVDLDANLKSDGKKAKLDAKGTGTQLALVEGGSPAKVPVGLDLAADYDLAHQMGTLTRGVVKIGNSPANINGTFDTSGATTKLNMKLDANSLQVGDIEGLLPAIGVILPAGASLQGGTASAHANITGPTDALVTTGTVNVENTKLTGFDLGSKMSAIAKLAGIGASNDTPIQLFSSGLRMSPMGIQADDIKLIVPTIGVLTGAGTIDAHNELNFKMRAELNSSNNAIGALTQVAGLSQKNPVIPFKIAGTTSSPVFIPDVGGTLGTMAPGTSQGPAGVLGNLEGLFGKKKKQ
jgi:AsmA protein